MITAQDGDGGVSGVASGFRSGRHYAAEQSFPWTRHLCCDMGCGVRADLQHVTLGWCAGMVGGDVYRAHVRTCLAGLLKRIPKPREPTLCTPMCEWQCPARVLVITAQQAMREELQGRGWASEWSALQQVVAGILPEPLMLRDMRTRQRAHTVDQVCAAVEELQSTVHEGMLGRWDNTRECRQKATAEREWEHAMSKAADAADVREAQRLERMRRETEQAAASVRTMDVR